MGGEGPSFIYHFTKQLIYKGVTVLLCDLRKRIFQNPFPTREGRVDKSLQERTTMTASLRSVIQLVQRKRWQSQKLPYSLLPSSENAASSGYGGIQICHSPCACLPKLASYKEEPEVASAHLPLPGLGHMLELLQL